MVASRGLVQGNDMQRLGLFSEMGYVTIKEPYTSASNRPFNVAASKGKQMLTASTKSKTGLCDGYFHSEFGRVFEKEAYSDPVKRRRKERIENAKKNITTKAFLPSSCSKKASGVGNTYGTFRGIIEHFKGVERPPKPYSSPGRNFICNPPKKGSGYGFVDITINKVNEHLPEPLARAHDIALAEQQESKRKMVSASFKLAMHPKATFDINPYKSDKPLPARRKSKDNKLGPPPVPFKPTSPAKRSGNCKAGTFTPYPDHPIDGYKVKPKKGVGARYGVFRPSAGHKTRPTDSIMRSNVNKRINITNHRTLAPSFA